MQMQIGIEIQGCGPFQRTHLWQYVAASLWPRGPSGAPKS